MSVSTLVRRIAGALAVFALSAILTANAVTASVYYVDGDQPDDTGDGLSWLTAMKAIQTAIDSSAMGDTILVKHGIYTISADIVIGSTRLLTSDDGTHDSWDSAAQDSSLCVVAPTVVSRVFTIDGAAVTADTRLRGFKITGGRATSESPGALYGGGVYITNGADPVIEHCWITGNYATTSGSNGYGGGIACQGAGTSVVIRNCLIEYNIGSSSYFGSGAGLYFGDAALSEVRENTIIHNTASTKRAGIGGGICASNTDLLILSNTISYNVGASSTAAAGGSGGGIHISHGKVKVRGNVITYNHAGEARHGGKGGGINLEMAGIGDTLLVYDNPAISYNISATHGAGDGGGLYSGTSYIRVYGNTFEGNIASSSDNTSAASYRVGRGGGIYVASTGSRVYDNLIIDNTASLHGAGSGGGVFASGMQPITGNVIAFNVASASVEGGYGGGLWTSDAYTGTIYNNTLYRNANTTAPFGAGAGSGWYHSQGELPEIRNNIFAGHDVAGSDSTGAVSNSAGTIWYNCFHDNPGGDYNANLTSNEDVLADPRLTDPDNGDFTLMYDSPCIEEGDPAFAVPEHGGWVIDIGALEYTGTRHWRPVAGTGLLLFGGRVKAKVDVTTLGTLSEIDMVVHPGETHPAAPVSVARWYDIDHVGSGMEFDLTCTYLDSELGGRAEDSLDVWRWTGMAWDGPKEPSARDLVNNWIEVSGQTEFSDWIFTDDWGPTAAEEMPRRFALFANYPNPFNPSTVIAYELARPSHVELSVYNVAGQLVNVLVDCSKDAGYHRVEWDGLNLRGSKAASGVYFYRLAAGDFVRIRKMVLLR